MKNIYFYLTLFLKGPVLKLMGNFSISRHGFSLIELMVVVAVIAILATIALFGLRAAQGSARNNQRLQIMNAVRRGLEGYNLDRGGYVTGSNFSVMFTALTGQRYFTSLPVDPGCGDGQRTFPSLTVDASGNWLPCGAGEEVTYNYSGTAGSYTLILNKESGGSSTFKNIQ